MSERHGLKERTVSQIQEVLALFPQVESAVLFGSRAKGVQNPGSDIDLALGGEGLDWRVLGRIEDALDDLLLPYTFSLLHHRERTNPELAGHIARVGVPFYRRGVKTGLDSAVVNDAESRPERNAPRSQSATEPDRR